jgi:hypothetical protein
MPYIKTSKTSQCSNIYILVIVCKRDSAWGFLRGSSKQSTRIEDWLQDLDRSIWFGPLIIFCINPMLCLRPFRLIFCLALCMNMRVPKNHEFLVYEYKSIFTCSLGYMHGIVFIQTGLVFFFKLEVIYVLIIFVKFELYMNFETNRLDFFIRKN